MKLIKLILLSSLVFSVRAFAQAVFYSPSSGSNSVHNGGYFFDQMGQDKLTATLSVESFAGFVQNLILFAGICMVFVALTKYFDYRKNPQYSPISNVVSSLFVALFLFGLGLVNSGVI
ncbi:MAG: hypothetical protein FJ186_01700 [Gammaproteobacteria bacterium]|jgi:hypothetical protein|nr:hypothetical protein [Gammaproteobacteria bacterium]